MLRVHSNLIGEKYMTSDFANGLTHGRVSANVTRSGKPLIILSSDFDFFQSKHLTVCNSSIVSQYCIHGTVWSD